MAKKKKDKKIVTPVVTGQKAPPTTLEIINSKLLVKEAEYKRTKQRREELRAELQKTGENLIKIASAYATLDELAKSLTPVKQPKK